MLNEYKEQCKHIADIGLGPNWQKLGKNELCTLYITNEKDRNKANAYFSALLYKYWSLIGKYHSLSYNVADPEDVYSWLVDSITYALDHRRWEDEDSHIYQDVTGPDKVINRRMQCARLTYYQFINRKKRKDNFDTLSLDQLYEAHGDNLDLEDIEKGFDSPDLDINNFIRESFLKKDYFLAFLLDILLTENVFQPSGDKPFNYKKVIKILKRLDIPYCEQFAHTYDLDSESVISTLKYFKKNSTPYLQHKIEYYITLLIHNNTFKEVLNVN